MDEWMRYKTLPAVQADKTQVTTYWVVKPEQSRACQLGNWFPVQNSSVVVPQLFLRQRRLPTQMYSKQLVPKQAELSHTQGGESCVLVWLPTSFLNLLDFIQECFINDFLASPDNQHGTTSRGREKVSGEKREK